VGGVKIVAVIPAWNEEGSIGRVVAAVPGDLVAEVIVVNNGSTDRTPEVARRPAPGSCSSRNAATGRPARRDWMRHPTRHLVYLDGDASDQPEELANVLGPVTRGEAELVIGSRLLGQREAGAMPPHAVFGNWLTARLVRLLYGVRITDLGSFRAIRRADLEALGMRERTHGWPVEMIVKAARRGYRIHEVPVSHRKRIGKSKVAGTLDGQPQGRVLHPVHDVPLCLPRLTTESARWFGEFGCSSVPEPPNDRTTELPNGVWKERECSRPRAPLPFKLDPWPSAGTAS
jgi:hypothetical protein